MTKWANDVTPDKVHPEYPRPQMVRKEWQNLNGLWDYAVTAKDADAPKEYQGKILVPFPIESALSGVMKSVGERKRLWYRRTFEVSKTWKEKRVLLHFGAVDWETTVWVNGKKLGDHRGGYDAFSFDITDALKKDGKQELVVGVLDPSDGGTQPRGKQVRKPEGIWYTPTTGIWQTVWLEPVTVISSLTIKPDLDKKQVSVFVWPNGHAKLKKPILHIRVLEAGKEVASFKDLYEGPLIGNVFDIPKPKPWSPESPFLYDLEVTISDEELKSEDQVHAYFAMRKVSIGKDDKGTTRILLNGKPYFMVGPLDQGFWPDGLYTAPSDAALKYDIEMTKKLGFNMTRKHVKVEPDRWYYWCDKLGLLVWQDMPSGDKSIGDKDPDIKRSAESAKQYELELKRMIDGLHNHPCIVMWVVFNEGWGQFDTERITNWTKKHDPSRLVNCASGWADRKVGDVHDLHAYPGPGSPDPEPKRAAVLGEFGGLGLGIDKHTWSDKKWSYQGQKDSAELTRKYERLLMGVYKLKDKPGLSAAVYTQITDVETEINGLLTYDRAVVKVDAARVAGANKGDFSKAPKVRVLVPTARDKGIKWRYTLDKPAAGWFKPGYDDSGWKVGPGGFGTKGTPGAIVRTEWKTDDIWIRREFALPEGKFDNLYLDLHHDEDAEIYINGVLAAKVAGFITDYTEVAIDAKAKATLKAGKNTIAVHCHQTTGGQYIDVGIVEIK
jgi:hypothetical protein